MYEVFMKIYFTRHGKTDWNELHKVQGTTNIPLNSLGIRQAEETKKILADKQFDLIISSPLQRAIKTAEIIKGDRHTKIITDERITERKFGKMEGKIDKELNEYNFWDMQTNLDKFNIEKVSDFSNRVFDFIKDITKKYSDKNILVVSHAGVSIFFKLFFEQIDPSTPLLSLCINNCEVLEYDV